MARNGLGASRWQVHASHRKTMRSVFMLLLMLAAVQFVAWVIPVPPGAKAVDYYLTLHTMMEGVSIIVAMMVFIVGWNSRDGKMAGNLALLACFFLAIAGLDFSHTEAYGGMPDFFTPNGPDKHLNFWIAARLLAATALLLTALRPWDRELQKISKYALVTTLIVGVIAFNWVVINYQDALPDLFIPGQGLTPLKKNLEYLCIGINLTTMLLLWGKMRTEQSFNVPLLFGAAAVMAMSEFFTLYTTMTGAYNVLGHVYKVISYLLIYRAVVVESIERPYLELKIARTKLTLAMDASTDARQSLQNTLDAIPSLVAYWDENLINKFANKAYTDYFGKAPEQLLGTHISSLLGEDLYHTNLPFLQAALRGEEQNFERSIPSPDGWSTKYTKAKYLPDITKGKVKGLYVFVFDVSDLKEALETLTRVTADLQTAKGRMELATQSGGIGIWELDTVNNALQWDETMYALYGVDPKTFEVAYDAWRNCLHPGDCEEAIAIGLRATAGEVEYQTEFRVIRPDGEVRVIRALGQLQRDNQGRPLRLLGTNWDITEQKLNEQALKKSVEEKDALLKEVHHRVKNNLQVITSLMRLEAGRSTVADTKAVLGDMQARIRAMALLHESLYRTGTFASVDLGSYLRQLATQSFRAQSTISGSVRLELNLGSVQVSMDQAIPCGLLINELISNCFKHGFPAGVTGHVRIELQPLDTANQWQLRVCDTGVGLPDNFEEKRKNSLGLQLVGDLARQIGSELTIAPNEEKGASFTVNFQALEPAELVMPA